MTEEFKETSDDIIAAYDEEAEASGWYGPEVAFGLAFAHIHAGQSLLDIGIGTGLGSVLFRKAGLEIHGMDISQEMLDACRRKGFTSLHLHDICTAPYPFDPESFDIALSTGVFNFINDLSPVFKEVARILRKDGLFAFVVGDRSEDETFTIEVGKEHTMSDQAVTMYRHSVKQIGELLSSFGFKLLRDLPFTVYMNRDKTRSMAARAYVVRNRSDNLPESL
jgi:predicted TPR repeat methyltransferase